MKNGDLIVLHCLHQNWIDALADEVEKCLKKRRLFEVVMRNALSKEI